jgi:predicted phage tail protein
VRTSLVPTAPPPADFRATLDAQGPLLLWNVQSTPAPSPGVSYRLRIYRRVPGKTEFALASEQPYSLGEDEARDTNFEWEQAYDYKIASVAVLTLPGRPAVEVEGNDSETLRLSAHDIFPPAAPTGLQAVFSSVGQTPFIDLTWAPNTESDLAGYVVYRRTAASTFVAVSAAPIKAPAWRDNDVHPGQKYYYTVSAVDLRGNQSPQSAPAEELVPMEVR